MAAATTKSAYWQGIRDGTPFLLVVLPFGMLFGVVARDAGLDLFQLMSMSMLVIAGAAQFTALQMMNDNASILMVLLAALAVNLRMAMYSAALAPHLGKARFWQRALVAYMNVDQTFAVGVSKFESEPDWTIGRKLAFFFGVATPIVPGWYLFSLAGALIGSAMPGSLALDFTPPITFIAIFAPMLRTAAHLAAAATSIVVALALYRLPPGVGVLIAAAAAMAVGSVVELLGEGRKR